MKRDFGGEAAAYYHQHRHGYPRAVIDALVGAFKLTGQDVVVDLGCGTGQLTALSIGWAPRWLIRAAPASKASGATGKIRLRQGSTCSPPPVTMSRASFDPFGPDSHRRG